MFRFIFGSFLVHNKSGSGSKGREQAEKWAKICIWGQSESEAAPTAAAAVYYCTLCDHIRKSLASKEKGKKEEEEKSRKE